MSYITLTEIINYEVLSHKGVRAYYEKQRICFMRVETDKNGNITSCTLFTNESQPFFHCTNPDDIYIDVFLKMDYLHDLLDHLGAEHKYIHDDIDKVFENVLTEAGRSLDPDFQYFNKLDEIFPYFIKRFGHDAVDKIENYIEQCHQEALDGKYYPFGKMGEILASFNSVVEFNDTRERCRDMLIRELTRNEPAPRMRYYILCGLFNGRKNLLVDEVSLAMLKEYEKIETNGSLTNMIRQFFELHDKNKKE